MMLPRAGPRWLCMSIRMSSRPSFAPGMAVRNASSECSCGPRRYRRVHACRLAAGRACRCRRDFAGNCLGRRQLAASTTEKTHVDVILVSGVLAGREPRRKIGARGEVDVVAKPLLLGVPWHPSCTATSRPSDKWKPRYRALAESLKCRT